MDILAILQATFAGLNFSQIVAGLVGGVLIKMFFDNVLIILLGKYWPEEALKLALKKLKWFDDNVLDKLAEKYPKTGKALEKKFLSFLDDAKEIIKN